VDAVRVTTEDGLDLQAELRIPEGGPAVGSAVICHAHPRMGGSKDHPVLWALRSELSARGFAVLGFNFRGVMGSPGEFGGGELEVLDVRAAIGAVREAVEGGPTLVCGWSFGAHTALREAVGDDRVAGLALLGMPVGESSLDLPPLPDRTALRAFDRPVLLVAGEADQFCTPPDLRSFARKLSRPTVVVLPNTDHFFWKHERTAAEAVGSFASSLVEPVGSG
jgi:alpha/beta superfamily hydrolase